MQDARTTKTEYYFTPVLKSVRQGGWGKAAMHKDLPDMTVLQDDDGTTTYDRATIASSATQPRSRQHGR